MKRILLGLASFLAVLTLSMQRAQAQTWTGVSPATAASATSDDEKTVYLWNVNKKCFLEKGGRWGTEAILGTATNGLAFKVEKQTSGQGNNKTTYYCLNTQMNAQGSSGNAYLGFMGTATAGSQWDKYNYFADRASSGNYNYVNYTFTKSGTGYTIAYTLSGTAYYMCAALNSSSTSQVDESVAINAFTSSEKTNDVWQLVTKKERDEYFATSAKHGMADAGATYLAQDYSFARRDLTISNWKTADGKDMVNGRYSDGEQTLTPIKAITTTETTTTTYYKYTYTGKCSGKRTQHDNTYTTDWVTTPPSEIEKTHKQNCTGSHFISTPQVTLTLDESKTESKTETTTNTSNEGYTYYVGNGIDGNSDSQLEPGGKWTANIHGVSGKLYQTISVPAAGSYRVTCKGLTTSKGTATFYAKGTEKTATQTFFETSRLDVNTSSYIDAWTELQNNDYFSAVTVYVGDDKKLEFGVEVSDGQADSWACFDDFEIEYVDNGQYNVVLDETKESVDYLNTQNANDKVKTWKVTANLHRSFTAGVWNTIVLPFDVNKGSLVSAFGAGTQISRFKGAVEEDNPHVLYFEPATSIEKDHLYLIMPTIAEPQSQDKVTATASDDLTLEGKYYQLHGVSFARTDYTYPIDGLVGGQDKGKETYEGETNLVFKGTYKQALNVVPAYSYLIMAGTTDVEGSTGKWYYRTITSHSRAFRGWLQPDDTTQGTAVQSIYINGIEYPTDATPVEGLVVDTDTAPNGNIYNLSGQLVRANATTTDGLPKGLYIVGGKKIVVR